jgi:hypothetical protein
VLLEGERQIAAFLELTAEEHERAETEPAQGLVEKRGANGHTPTATSVEQAV